MRCHSRAGAEKAGSAALAAMLALAGVLLGPTLRGPAAAGAQEGPAVSRITALAVSPHDWALWVATGAPIAAPRGSRPGDSRVVIVAFPAVPVLVAARAPDRRPVSPGP